MLDARRAVSPLFAAMRVRLSALSSRFTTSRVNRPLAALLLLATLVLGAAFHELHHLQDPGCGTRTEDANHFCPCSGLHASAIASHVAVAPSPVAVVSRLDAPLASLPRDAERVLSASPRAPPRG